MKIKTDVDTKNLGKVEVSTVSLPFDHSFGDGPPLLFETMVFDMVRVWQAK